MSQILDGLNTEQLTAVTLPHNSALVLAGAGSGKTRVLTTRIAWLIQTGQVSPMSVLAVTFTNKAAREMLARISAMLPVNTRGMWVGTFHGLCNRLLRAHHRDAGLHQTFQILDSADQLAMLKRVMKGIGVDTEKYPPRQVQYFINFNKEEGRRANTVEVHDDYDRQLNDVYSAYETQCNREGVVDFAELLLRCFELLQKNEILRAHYQNRFRHILVDEFQDTNRLQYMWLKLLTGPESAIVAVGDDDQSIYAFRGARSGNMLDFETDFGVEKVIKLEQNYRSHGNILDAANALIRNNRTRLGKNLWTSEGSGEPIRVFDAPTDIAEAAFVVEEVQALSADGIKLSDMALLYRSNAQSRVFEHALFSASISYRVYGGLRFFERQEIKHVLAYLRLVANPEDDGAVLRVINFPTRGIGNRTLEQLQLAADRAGTSLWQAACENLPSGRAGAAVASFVRMIESMRQATEGLPLEEIVDHVNNASGLIEHYRKEREGADRIENLEELVNAAAAFVAEEGLATYGADVSENDQVENTSASISGDDAVSTSAANTVVADTNTPGAIDVAEIDPLSAFLAHASLEAGDNQASAGTDALQLMTVHSAKGLEFHTVFISGLEEGLFPHENSLNEDGGLEEERRLMYVAMTRARRRLYLSFTQTRMLHGQTRYNVPSRFLEEVPPKLLKRLNPPVETFVPPAASSTPITRGRSAPVTVGGFRIGQNVVHPKFGSGVIVQAEGRGGDARVQVNFRNEGLKWLALEYAKLSPA